VKTALRMMAEATFDVRASGDDGADAWVEMNCQLPDSVRNVMSEGGDGWVKVEPVGTTPTVNAAIPAAAPVDGTATSGKLFARQAVDSALLGNAEQGAFVVRVGELARVPALAQAFPLLNGMIREELQQQVGVAQDDVPEIHLEAIEWIAGTPRLKIKPKAGPDKGQEGQVMFECDGFVVRFRDKVDWKSWIFKAMPGAEEIGEVRGEKFNYVELPTLMGGTAFGTQQFLVAARDERTLVVSPDLEQLRKLVASTGAEANAGIGAEWTALEGGLATLVVNTDAKGPLGLPQEPGSQLTESILEKSRQFGIAFDVDPATGESQLRMNLAAENQAAAEQVKSAVEGLLPMFIAQMTAELAHPTQLHVDKDAPLQPVQTLGDANTEANVANFWLAMLKSCTPRISSQADGGVRVELTATATLPWQVMVAYEYVENDAAEDTEKAERR
jgi:hypothetical protein